MSEFAINQDMISNQPLVLTKFNYGQDWLKQKLKVKKNGFGLQLDALGWALVVLIIAGIALLAVFQLKNAARVAGTKQEMSTIQDAVVQYEGLRNDAKTLDSLSTLLQDPCISATNAIDGIDHKPLLPDTNNRWAGGNIVDMWGAAYEFSYDPSTQIHTLTSTGSGQNITINF